MVASQRTGPSCPSDVRTATTKSKGPEVGLNSAIGYLLFCYANKRYIGCLTHNPIPTLFYNSSSEWLKVMNSIGSKMSTTNLSYGPPPPPPTPTNLSYGPPLPPPTQPRTLNAWFSILFAFFRLSLS